MQQTRPAPPVQYGSDPVQSNRRPPPPSAGPPAGAAMMDNRRYAPEPHTPVRETVRGGGGPVRNSRYSDQYYDDVSDEDDSLGSFRSHGDKEMSGAGQQQPAKKKPMWKIWR
ncbi:Metallo-dependent phosphatase [Neofusicoccum parvum]|nr:Metallo-dependent phosphatase [Neofusicoccum parvum]